MKLQTVIGRGNLTVRRSGPVAIIAAILGHPETYEAPYVATVLFSGPDDACPEIALDIDHGKPVVVVQANGCAVLKTEIHEVGDVL